MARYSNHVIPRAWANGEAAESHTGNFTTDGKSIWSYSLCIGETLDDGSKLLHDYTAGGISYYSQTTSCHVGRCRGYADLLRTATEIIDFRKQR